MASVGTYDIAIRRGSTAPAVTFVMRVRDADGAVTVLDMTGSIMVLTIKGPGVSIVKSSADGGLVVDTETGRVTWNRTLAESRKFPAGKAIPYELERRVAGDGGEQRVYVKGTITSEGGISGD